jgi:thiol-disulfide isomerase/thioredoxin
LKIKLKYLTIILCIIALAVIGLYATGLFSGSNEGGVNVIGTTIGNFKITDQTICRENEKPVVYYFGSTSCPHCRWEHPIISGVAGNFSGYIVFHDNMDKQVDMDIYQRYNNINTGYIPFLVFGCKYARVGSGESLGQDTETKVLTALMCKLTDNKPSDICSQVTDLINQI